MTDERAAELTTGQTETTSAQVPALIEYQDCKRRANTEIAHLYRDVQEWWSTTEVMGEPAYLAIFSPWKRQAIIDAAAEAGRG
jgi:hypothetical protein